METDAEWERNLQRMLCTIGLDATAIVEEVLQAGLQVNTKVRREVVLQAKTKIRRPLNWSIEGRFFLEGVNAVGNMTDIHSALDRQLQHYAC